MSSSIYQENDGASPVKALGYALTTVLMYLGVPVAGWGLGDVPGFFASGPRVGYAIVVTILGAGIGWQSLDSQAGFRGRSGQEESLVPRQRLIKNAVIALLYAGLLFVPFADRHGILVMPSSPVARWIGVALFAVGIGLVFWSGLTLGRLYSGDVTLQDNHELVTDAPYNLIRHPRYTGGIVLALGLALTFRSWIGLAAMLLFIGVVLYRIHDEEAMMKEAFGTRWDDYCDRTKRLIPFIF